MQDALAATVNGHQVDNIDLQLLRGDGKTGQFSGNLSPMRDEQGNVSSIVVVMTDITDAALLQSETDARGKNGRRGSVSLRCRA